MVGDIPTKDLVHPPSLALPLSLLRFSLSPSPQKADGHSTLSQDCLSDNAGPHALMLTLSYLLYLLCTGPPLGAAPWSSQQCLGKWECRVLQRHEKYRAMRGIAAIVSQYRAIWGH